MNTLDFILILCFIPAVIQGISKGFVEQAVAIVSILLGVWMSFKFSTLVCTWLQPALDVSPRVLNIIAFVLILAVVIIVLHLLGKAAKGLIKIVMLGWLDKLLGIAFAILKAALLVGLVIILFDSLNSKLEIVKSETLEDSVLYGAIKNLAYTVYPYFKELLFKD